MTHSLPDLLLSISGVRAIGREFALFVSDFAVLITDAAVVDADVGLNNSSPTRRAFA
jgi:hypothetical protein